MPAMKRASRRMLRACEGCSSETIKSVSQFAKGQVAAMVAAQRADASSTSVAFNGPDGKPDLTTRPISPARSVLLNLWATWCVPCREEMPALNALEKEMGSDKFQVVAGQYRHWR